MPEPESSPSGAPRRDLIAVIPAYQTERSVGDVVRRLRPFVERVIVVDDGSDDETSLRAREAGAQVFRLLENRGKGFALRRGIDEASAFEADGLILLDADGQHAPEDLPSLFAEWDRGECDLLIGCRLDEPDVIPGPRFWTNYIGSRILSWMSGRELFDSQSGYRLVRQPLIQQLGLSSDGYAIETEMLLKACYRGARVGHAKIRTIYDDETSYFQPVRDTVRIALAAIYFKVFHED